MRPRSDSVMSRLSIIMRVRTATATFERPRASISGTWVCLKKSVPSSSLYSLSKVPPVTRIRMVMADAILPEFAGSDVQADRAHQLESVRLAYDAGMQAVVEGDPAVLEVVLEVDVGRARGEDGGDLGEREVVRGRETDGAQIDQVAEHGLGTDAPVVRVGAAEQLVEQEEQGRRSLRQVRELPQPRDLGVEPRASVLQGIDRPDRGADG